MAPRKEQIAEALGELTFAHTQLIQTRNNHLNRSDSSQIVLNMFDTKIRELEEEIAFTSKAFFGGAFLDAVNHY